MKTAFVLFAAAFAVTASSASAANFSGRWATEENGETNLKQVGNTVDGTFALKDGRVRAEVNGDWLAGIWAQSSSGRRCARAQLDSFYWGHFKVRMNPDGARWSGGWSYCDDPEATGGGWNGKRIAGNSATWQIEPNTDVTFSDGTAPAASFTGRWSTAENGETRLNVRDGRVNGSYAWKDGRVSGTASGNRLSGIWAQSESGRRCSSQQMGSFYWGRFGFQLAADANHWTGHWSYCDEPEGSGGSWNGTRIGE